MGALAVKEKLASGPSGFDDAPRILAVASLAADLQKENIAANDELVEGPYHDAESGLFYNWNRYYDPRVGRFITADPRGINEHVQGYMAGLRASKTISASAALDSDITALVLANEMNGTPLELNPYAYVANNPLRWIDPEGLACEYKGFDKGGLARFGNTSCRCIWECGDCPKVTKYTYGELRNVRGRGNTKYNACTCEVTPGF